MSHESDSTGNNRLCLWGILALLGIYAGVAAIGWPQQATTEINRHLHPTSVIVESKQAQPTSKEVSGEENPQRAHPPLVATLPFILLLGAIAVLPLIPQTEHWWESNLHRFLVAAAMGLLTLGYYIFFYGNPVERHFVWHGETVPTGAGPQWQLGWTVFQNAILVEYIPFIILLFSLYTICGGIRISGDLPAHPLTNTVFLLIGGTIASLIGTTGAAMVLIRPLLETNQERKRIVHTVVFFIFIVCNCGGCLLPIGDPPLFLGYLEGVPFLWTLSLWKEWLFINGALLAIYYLWDRFYAYPHEEARTLLLDETQVRRLTFQGLGLNLPLLLGVVLAVALLDPSKPIPGTDWHAWLWLREAVQLGLVAVSLLAGREQVRRDNRFNYAAIIEVAALFLGIFLCMQPALQILDVQGASLGLNSPAAFFWMTGALSSVLDNAPTYLVFFETARSLPAGTDSVAGVPASILTAISLGAVMMGAMTYIGNGPNMMVKSIAEKSGVKMPSFFGYVAYSCLILLPLLLVMQQLFVR